MRYPITWPPELENDLARIWMAAADPEAVRQASDEIDRLLRDVPQARGNDQAGTYELTVFPLRVIYTVSPDDRLVSVMDVTSLD